MVVVKVVIRVMDFRLCEDFWGLMDRDRQTNEDMNIGNFRGVESLS